VAIGAIRADDRHQRDHTGVREQSRYLADAPNVLAAIRSREAEVAVEAVAEVVAVEQIGRAIRVEQPTFAQRGDRGLARSRQTGEPHRRASRQASVALDARMPCDVAHWAEPMIIPAATVLLVASSTRTNEPVARFRRYSSKNNGSCVRSEMRPISLSLSSFTASSRCSVLTSSRYCNDLTSA